MAPKIQFHEGKAIDAVVRYIERRENAKRINLRFPEQEQHQAPVELTCEIGDQLYAFEHTGIEPFSGHIQLEAEAETHLKPIEAGVAGKLPPNETFTLLMHVGRMRGLRGASVRRIHEVLVPWIIETAPTLPIARFGRYTTPIQWITVLGLDFEVSLQRSEASPFPGDFRISQLVPDDLESRRLLRVQEALKRKTPKLAVWKRDYGARSVLVLEENDIFVTNDVLVARAVSKSEEAIADKPDEIYLISSAATSAWRIIPLRVGVRGTETHEPVEVNPTTLRSITGRS